MTRQHLRWSMLLLLVALLGTGIACRAEMPSLPEPAGSGVSVTLSLTPVDGRQSVATRPVPTAVPQLATNAPRTAAARTTSVLATGVVTTCTSTITAVSGSQPITHTVRRGETLTLIARKYGTLLETLVAVNGIRDPHLIWVGQELMVAIPPTATPMSTDHRISYVVRRGETLSLIARKHGVSVDALAALNGMYNPNLIWVGQELVVRVPSTPTASSTAAPTPALTATPAPTRTDVPSTPEPLSQVEMSYARQAEAIGRDHMGNSQALVSLMNAARRDPSLLADDHWQLQIAIGLGALDLDARSLRGLKASPRFHDVHQDLLAASQLTGRAATLIPSTLDKLRPATMEEIVAVMCQGRDLMEQATKHLEELTAGL